MVNMEDCLEMVDALNALLSPGERELCEELMSTCEVTDFRCFHCPTRCDVELDMLRHCDQAHPYYETKYHLPSSFGSPTSTLMMDECRWMCCACSTMTRTRPEMEDHCVTYHRNNTSRHFFIDRTGLLKMSFTDRSFLQQPPLAPTPPQDSSDILFHDLASSEAELEKLSTHATQMAVMALTRTGDQLVTGCTTLPPISSLLHPDSAIQDVQVNYPRQDLYYNDGSSGVCYQTAPHADVDQTSDLGSSPAGSTYNEVGPVDFNQYANQPIDRCSYSSYSSYTKYAPPIEDFSDVSCSFEPHRMKIDDQVTMLSDGTRCYDESSNSLTATDATGRLVGLTRSDNSSSGYFASSNVSVDDVHAGGKSQRQPKLVKKTTVKRSRTTKAKMEQPHDTSVETAISVYRVNSGVSQRSLVCSSGVDTTSKSLSRKRSASSLLKLAGPLSAKRQRIRAALATVAGPASVKAALEKVNIELHLAILPPIGSGSSRSARDLDTLLEDHLRTHERAFIHIAGCKLKVRDYASVVDIHPAVQLTDVLRTAIK